MSATVNVQRWITSFFPYAPPPLPFPTMPCEAPAWFMDVTYTYLKSELILPVAFLMWVVLQKSFGTRRRYEYHMLVTLVLSLLYYIAPVYCFGEPLVAVWSIPYTLYAGAVARIFMGYMLADTACQKLGWDMYLHHIVALLGYFGFWGYPQGTIALFHILMIEPATFCLALRRWAFKTKRCALLRCLFDWAFVGSFLYLRLWKLPAMMWAVLGQYRCPVDLAIPATQMVFAWALMGALMTLNLYWTAIMAFKACTLIRALVAQGVYKHIE